MELKPTHISDPTPPTAYGGKGHGDMNTGRERHGLCICSEDTDTLPCGECMVCHRLKGHNLVFIEMTIDGIHWESVKLPPNCLPYHQTIKFGEYSEHMENGDIVRYRIKERENR